MKRRSFLKSGILVGIMPFDKYADNSISKTSIVSQTIRSKVIISKDKALSVHKGMIDSSKLTHLLDNGMQALFETDDQVSAWQKVVKRGEVIGLKVNCLSGLGSTHTGLVEIICERLCQAGIKAGDIVIWDRFNRDLEEGGYHISDSAGKIRCFGNETNGFESDLQMFGSAASLVCRTITRVCDGIINLPVLRDHSIAGVTISLKNMFGAINNPNKYHLNAGDPYIPDVWMLPPFRSKIKLNICDALEAQYEGGPSFMSQWRWPFKALLLSTDPVSLDQIGWKIIEDKRKERGLKSLKTSGREPKYIKTAADALHGLGVDDPARIDVIEV